MMDWEEKIGFENLYETDVSWAVGEFFSRAPLPYFYRAEIEEA